MIVISSLIDMLYSFSVIFLLFKSVFKIISFLLVLFSKFVTGEYVAGDLIIAIKVAASAKEISLGVLLK